MTTQVPFLLPIVLVSQESEIRRIVVQSQQGQQGQIVCKTLSRKYPTQKRAEGMTQVANHLCSKCEALSSNPSITYTHTYTKSLGIMSPLTMKHNGISLCCFSHSLIQCSHFTLITNTCYSLPVCLYHWVSNTTFCCTFCQLPPEFFSINFRN
jgi:hypothetical protein